MGKPEDGTPGGSAALSRRLAVGGGLVAAVLLGAAGYVWLRPGAAGPGAPPFGGPFSLIGPTGTVTPATFRGRYMLVYFGYTFCPDVCPTTLNTIVQALERLGRRADGVQVLFITVDPARDTPAVVHEYTQAISPRILGLTGTPEQIAQAASAYHVYYQPHRGAGGDATAYSVDHSSIVYLQGPDGSPLALIPADASSDRMAAEIATYLPAPS